MPGLERFPYLDYVSYVSVRMPLGSPARKRKNSLIVLFIFLVQWGRGRPTEVHAHTARCRVCPNALVGISLHSVQSAILS